MKNLYKEVYKIYPKDISAIDNSEQYLISREYSELKNRLLNSEKFYGIENLKSAKTSIESEFDTRIMDITIENWLDRCYNWQFLLNQDSYSGEKVIMCINISKVIPIYFLYILEVEFDEELNRLKYLPRRNIIIEQTKYKSEIKKIKLILESKLNNIKAFPDDKLHKKIPDVSFQDIELGKFTMFNAYFLNNFTTRFA